MKRLRRLLRSARRQAEAPARRLRRDAREASLRLGAGLPGTPRLIYETPGEVLVFDRLLDPEERAKILAYLYAKWGPNVPVTETKLVVKQGARCSSK